MNRIGQVNLEWEPDVLAGIAAEQDLGGLFRPDELAEYAQPAPDVEFKEYTEEVENDVKYCTCPNCGHKFPQ
jgi:hypothetical protein